MKKFIFLIFSFIFMITITDAKTYYGEYGEYSLYQDDEIISSDVISTEKTKFYHAYNSVNYLEEYIDFSYNINDDSTIIYDDYTEDFSDIDDRYKFEVCRLYTYNKRKKYDYLIIRNNGDFVYFDSFRIYDDNKEKYITNFSIPTLEKGDIFIVKIFDENNIGIQDLELFIDIGKNVKNYNLTLGFSETGDYLKKDELIFETLSSNDDYREYFLYDFSDIADLYEEDILENSCGDFVDGRVLSKLELYRNYKVINKRNNFKKEYLDLFTNLESDDYSLDYDDYIYKFRYKTRDKVVLEDDIVIDNYDADLKDYITYTSVNLDDIKVTSDLDLYKNGIYKVNYIFPFETISTSVVVDNKNNYINFIKEQEEYIDLLQAKTDEATYLVDKKNLEIKETIVNSENVKNDLENELYYCKNKDIKKEELDIVNTSDNNSVKYMSMIGIILFLLISIMVSKVVEKRRLKRKTTFVDIGKNDR